MLTSFFSEKGPIGMRGTEGAPGPAGLTSFTIEIINKSVHTLHYEIFISD